MKSTCCRQLTISPPTTRYYALHLSSCLMFTRYCNQLQLTTMNATMIYLLMKSVVRAHNSSSSHQPLCYDICGTSEVGLDIAINTIQEMTIPMNPSKRDGRRDIGYRRYESISISMEQDVGGYFFLATVRRQEHRAYSGLALLFDTRKRWRS